MNRSFQPLLIGISGFNASGKTTVAKMLIVHFSAESHRFSAVLSTIAAEIGLPTDKETLQNLSTVLRSRLGEDILARGMCEWVTNVKNPVIVVEGIRRIADIELLEATARETGRAWHLFFIDAPYDTRFSRINARRASENLAPLTADAFQALEQQECEIELPEIKRRSHRVFDNVNKSPSEVTVHILEHKHIGV